MELAKLSDDLGTPVVVLPAAWEPMVAVPVHSSSGTHSAPSFVGVQPITLNPRLALPRLPNSSSFRSDGPSPMAEQPGMMTTPSPLGAVFVTARDANAVS